MHLGRLAIRSISWLALVIVLGVPFAPVAWYLKLASVPIPNDFHDAPHAPFELVAWNRGQIAKQEKLTAPSASRIDSLIRDIWSSSGWKHDPYNYAPRFALDSDSARIIFLPNRIAILIDWTKDRFVQVSRPLTETDRHLLAELELLAR